MKYLLVVPQNNAYPSSHEASGTSISASSTGSSHIAAVAASAVSTGQAPWLGSTDQVQCADAPKTIAANAPVKVSNLGDFALGH